MLNNISAQIDNINRSLAWIREHRPEDYNARFLQLVEERRKLRRLENANRENPAIAAYGVSQVGKSYLMNSILQQDSTPFTIDSDERSYRFIEEMNPQTKNTEATGVVTRFTSFKRHPELYSSRYPIMMRCLTAKDVVLIVTDGYFNDLNDYGTYEDGFMNEMAERVYEKYKGMPALPAPPMHSEDILEIKAYIAKHINNAQNLLRTSYLDRLALVIENIPVDDWSEVFSVLWHRSSYQTRLFEKLVSTLRRLDFADYIYLPASALLHNGINENTIMSVQCLNELFLESPRFFTNVYLRRGDTFVEVKDLTKSEVCAVCAEIVVKIADRYLEHTDRYCLDDITDPDVRAKINTGDVKMDILRDNDLLDFPGARTRKKEQSETLVEDPILINVLLRGKVAYLFNLYNEARLINILLFCHHNEQNEVTDVPLLLKNWILTYVGDTIEKRSRTLELTGGISPLFYVATKFNIDMQLESADAANSENSLHGRWQQRFYKVLYHQCFNADGCLDADKEKIFFNWSRRGESFSNSYLLRDFKYSGPLYSKLYENEKDPSMPSRRTVPDDYYARMRSTFCSDENVAFFFPDPEMSWDMAATTDNDGALYIIENLAKVARRMDSTRERQFEDLFRASVRKVLDMMRGYYTSTDADEVLESNLRKARDIMRELDFTCNSDNYYFGRLIKELQYTEREAGQVVHRMLHSPVVVIDGNDWKYEIIRKTCKRFGFPLDQCRTDDEKWQAIMETYNLDTREDAVAYLDKRQVDRNVLFGKGNKPKLNSFMIAEAIFNAWADDIRSVEFITRMTANRDFDPMIMNNLVENIIKTAGDVKLIDRMSDAIAEYVNVVNMQSANENLLADILSSFINDFVLDLGYSCLSESQLEAARNVARGKRLPVFDYIGRVRNPASDAEITAMFDQMASAPAELSPSFEDNYSRWIEYMMLSYVSHLDIPDDFDLEANNKLHKLLIKIEDER